MEVKLIELILFQFHPWIKIVKEPPADVGIGLDLGKLLMVFKLFIFYPNPS